MNGLNPELGMNKQAFAALLSVVLGMTGWTTTA